MALYEEYDMAKVERTKNLPFVRGDIARFRHYAGVPLNPYNGPNIGTIFTFSETPLENGLSPADRLFLFETASHINKHLEQAVEALEGKRVLRFNQGVASLLRIGSSAEVVTDPKSEQVSSVAQSGQEPLVSNLYANSVLRLYRLASSLLYDTFEFDGVRIQEVGLSGAVINNNPDWNRSSLLAQHLGPGISEPQEPSPELIEKLLDWFPHGGIIQLLGESGDVVAATSAHDVAPVVDPMICAEIPRTFPGAQQIIIMPLWDTYHERNIGVVLGFANDQSRVYLGSTDLSSISAFCTTIMTQVRRLEVQAMDKIKSDFLGSVSHEMRTPLHGILSSLELLADTPYNEHQHDLLETARYSGISLLDTIDRVLHFSNISSEARMSDETASNGSAGPLSHQWSLLNNQSTISPTRTGNPNMVYVCEEIVHRESRRLRLKETDNALKFGEPSGCVRVSVDVDEASIKLSLVDGGKGIASDFLRYSIFDPFSQEDPTTEGTGLGLSIVKRTTNILGGKLEVDSSETRGSTFTATFPLGRVIVGSSQDTTNLPIHKSESAAEALPQLEMSLFPPRRWETGDTVRGRRCTSMLSASLMRGLNRWFQTTVVPWQTTSTQLRLIFLLYEDLQDAAQAHDDTGDVKRIILCPDLSSVPSLEMISLDNTAAITGPITLSSLQEALATLFPGQIAAPEPHGTLDHGAGIEKDQEESHEIIDKSKKQESGEESDQAVSHLLANLAIESKHHESDHGSPKPGVTPTADTAESWEVAISDAPIADQTRKQDTPQEEKQVNLGPPVPSDLASAEPRLLLVDDNAVNLKVLSMYARRCSKTPSTSVSGGQEAIDAFNGALLDGDGGSQRFDLIFLDLSMPVVSGFEVARQIRETEARMKDEFRTYICALTGLVSAKDRNAAYASGVDQYLVKPTKLKDLQSVVQCWRNSLDLMSNPEVSVRYPTMTPVMDILDPWDFCRQWVELQQCPRPCNSDNTPRYSESSDSAQNSTEVRGRSHFAMASSTDAAFVEEIDVEQELRMRANQKRPTKSGVNPPTRDSDDEDAPLLSPSRHDYGSVDDEYDNNEEYEWVGDADFRGLPWWKRPSIYWLLPPFMLFTIAFGGIIVPKINLIMDLVCEEYYATLETDPISSPMDPGQDRCQNDAVSSRSSLFLLYASLCSGILSAIISPKIGALSDRYGRKKFMIANTCGALFGEVLTILAAKFPETVHVNWILVGYCLEGISGSFIVGMACAHSYASDCVAPQKRNVAFSYFHACLFGGIAIGPALAGYIINARQKYVGKTEAVLLIFYMALGAHFIFIAFLVFLVPESLSKARQETAREKHREELERKDPSADWINQLRSINLFSPLKILWPTGPGTSSAVRRNLILLAATDTIMFGVAMGAMSVVLVYTRRQFDWHELESGRFTTIVNSSRVFSLLIILPILTRIFRGKNARQRNSGSDVFDLSIIRASILFDTLGYLGFVLSRKGELFALSGAIAAIGGIGSPTLGAALTKHVPQDQVGQLLGATGLLHAIARVMGPTVFNGIYSATVGTYRQAVFVCLAGTFGLAFLCSWFIRPHVYIDTDDKRAALADEREA
ncbi:BaeS Signal transduction histidine kinase [Pyrenophora tritici-repentis]|nr:BaeS Signal transduction histidine kinase [Pyrenophora tritici-repentis]KAI1539469.1 BaeS Signal transduction histidine kinase [Pyrenophora tritici-repentis]PZD28615.1 BaeS, Signal transduction histidine kinase [Pyrenophora tritici-repentis]